MHYSKWDILYINMSFDSACHGLLSIFVYTVEKANISRDIQGESFNKKFHQTGCQTGFKTPKSAIF